MLAAAPEGVQSPTGSVALSAELVERVTVIWLGADAPFRDWEESGAQAHQHLDQTAEQLRRDPTGGQAAAVSSAGSAGAAVLVVVAGCIVAVAD